MHLGKSVRLERLFNRNTGRTVIVPLDHGVTVGPIAGLIDLKDTVDKIAEGGANAVLMHKGLTRCGHRGKGHDVGLIVHLSASTKVSPYPNTKTLVASVEDAIKLGADGVSVHVNLGDESERTMLSDFGEVATKCNEWGMPLLAMVYGRGPNVKGEFDPEMVRHTARVGEELGADVVKVAYTGDPDSFSKVVESCCIPVVIAGGPKMESDRELVQMVHDAVAAGGAGLSVGRNVFQHDDVTGLVQILNQVVHNDVGVDEALDMLASR